MTNATAQDMEAKAARIVHLGDQMSTLLETENEWIASRNYSKSKEYADLVARKQRMLLDYQGAVKSFLVDKEHIDLLTPARRAQLKATGSRLDTIAVINQEKLSITAAATHKVLQVIIDTMRRESDYQNRTAYHPNQFVSYKDERTPTSLPVFVTEKA